MSNEHLDLVSDELHAEAEREGHEEAAHPAQTDRHSGAQHLPGMGGFH
jgi:hypothetical protein